jgi:hypothetical protein
LLDGLDDKLLDVLIKKVKQADKESTNKQGPGERQVTLRSTITGLIENAIQRSLLKLVGEIGSQSELRSRLSDFFNRDVVKRYNKIRNTNILVVFDLVVWQLVVGC